MHRPHKAQKFKYYDNMVSFDVESILKYKVECAILANSSNFMLCALNAARRSAYGGTQSGKAFAPKGAKHFASSNLHYFLVATKGLGQNVPTPLLIPSVNFGNFRIQLNIALVP